MEIDWENLELGTLLDASVFFTLVADDDCVKFIGYNKNNNSIKITGGAFMFPGQIIEYKLDELRYEPYIIYPRF